VIALAWSGGKDSALALAALRAAGTPPSALMTTVDEASGRATMHWVGRELIRAQADAVGLPLVEVPLPRPCPNAVYEERMRAAFARPELRGVRAVAFGDLFLADIRAYREARLAEAGLEARFPLWGADTEALARRFLVDGFRATVVCVDPRALDPGEAGSAYDEAFLARLPADVDPCGERGEFHTFVADGPVFARPVGFELGPAAERDGFRYREVRPAPPARPA
jgi:uncharacterized protein (TIGR00290 family)